MNLWKPLLFTALLITALNAQAVQKVSLQLQWLDQFQFAGYYIAKEKGFYSEAGLDVELKKFDYNISVVNEVVSGRATFGSGRSSLIIDKNSGKEIVALAAIFQSSPSVLLTLQSSGLKTPSDLVDKRIMITPDEQSSAVFVSMLASQGVAKKDFIRQNHSFDLDDLINGKTDAMACYISNEPFVLDNKGIKYNMIDPKNYGFDFYGDMLYTSGTVLKQDPKMVRAFYEASLKGWEYAFDHIDETAQFIHKHYNAQGKSLKSLIYEGQVLKRLAYANDAVLGSIDKNRIKEITNIYKLTGNVLKEHTLDDFIYYVHLKEGVKLSESERRWLNEHPVLQLGIDNAWPPLEFIDENNHYSGIGAEYVRLIESELGINFEKVGTTAWNQLLSDIKNRKIDLISGIAASTMREEYMTFTRPYLSFPVVIIMKEQSNYIGTLNALSHKKIIVEEGYITQELLQLNYPDIKLLYADNSGEALQRLLSGEADAYLGHVPALNYYTQRMGMKGLKVVGETPYRFNLSFGVRKDAPELVSIMQKALDAIPQTDKTRIYEKWINSPYETKFDKQLLFEIALVGLSLLILLLGWIMLLKREVRSRKAAEKSLESANEKLCNLAQTDDLTGVANRRLIDERIQENMELSNRYNHIFSIILIDLDYFKNVNDMHGHLIGDKVLVEFAAFVKNELRTIDLLGRWGGEEFMIVAPGIHLEQAVTLTKRILNRLGSHAFTDHEIYLSFSAGVSQYRKDEAIETFVHRTDELAYAAKNSGKNMVLPHLQNG